MMTAATVRCPMGTVSACNFEQAPIVIADVDAGPASTCSVYRCKACGHGIALPEISDTNILYEARDTQDYQQSDGGAAETIKRIAFTNAARKLLKQIGFMPVSAIDYACGSGVFTSCLAALLPASSKVVAMDFFDEGPRNMGRAVYRPFRDQGKFADSADLLMCFHVLEHDNSPDEFVGRVLPLLKQGGTLVIEVPNIDCVWASIFGKYWDNWYLPFHRTHFSRKSLAAVIERNGLTIVSEHDICIPSFGRSLARMFGRSNNLGFLLAGAALHPIQLLGEILSRRPSALRIVARRQ